MPWWAVPAWEHMTMIQRSLEAYINPPQETWVADGDLWDGLWEAIPNSGRELACCSGGQVDFGQSKEWDWEDGSICHPDPWEVQHYQKCNPGSYSRSNTRIGIANLVSGERNWQAYECPMHGLNRWHKPSRGHHAFVQWGSCSSCYSRSCPRPCKQKCVQLEAMPYGCNGWSWQASLSWVPAYHWRSHQVFAPRQADLDVFCHVPHDHFGFQEPLHGRCTWDQFDGWAYAQGRLPVLCLCGRASEGSLPQHFVLQVANQSGDHLLQLSDAGGVIGQEDHRAWLLVLFHPLPHVPVSQESGLPRLQEWSLPVFGVFGPLHKRHWHSVCERGDQLWLSQELWDLPASHWPLWPFRSLGLGHQFCDIWWPLQPLPYWERVGYRDPTYPSDHWPGHLHMIFENIHEIQIAAAFHPVFSRAYTMFWLVVCTFLCIELAALTLGRINPVAFTKLCKCL